MVLNMRKTFGIILISIGVVIAIVGLVIIALGIAQSQPKYRLEVAIMLSGFYLFIAICSSVPSYIGFRLLQKKGQDVSKNINSPLVCPSCKLGYDNTWKVCLKCGKPLTERAGR